MESVRWSRGGPLRPPPTSAAAIFGRSANYQMISGHMRRDPLKEGRGLQSPWFSGSRDPERG